VGITSAAIEQFEAESYVGWEEAASPAAKAVLGTRQLRIGGGVALAMPNDPSHFWSKALGLGITEPVTLTLAEQVIDFYRAQGMDRFHFVFAPEAVPSDWTDICAKLNITAGERDVKLAGHLETITDTVQAHGGPAAYLDAGLRIERVGPNRASEWAAVQQEVFAYPLEAQAEMPTGAVGRPGWHAFAVTEDDEIVATGALRAAGRIGHLLAGATVPRVRGRGAQSALIAARAIAAREAGCHWLMAESGAEGPGEHNPSLHNMVRAGMSVRYERRTWTWQAR
jgi:hypothetical protein